MQCFFHYLPHRFGHLFFCTFLHIGINFAALCIRCKRCKDRGCRVRVAFHAGQRKAAVCKLCFQQPQDHAFPCVTASRRHLVIFRVKGDQPPCISVNPLLCKRYGDASVINAVCNQINRVSLLIAANFCGISAAGEHGQCNSVPFCSFDCVKLILCFVFLCNILFYVFQISCGIIRNAVPAGRNCKPVAAIPGILRIGLRK